MIIEDYWDGENWLEKIKYCDTLKYFLNEKYHRKDGPAIIRYNNDGTIKQKQYRINDELHRENGPAIIWYNNDGTIEKTTYCHNGEKHRKDGPADIWYYDNNFNILQNYYYNGKKFNPEDLPFEMPIDTKEKELMFKLKYSVNND